jgi:integrating conjugative element protein (TIGR03749 family)
MLHFRAPVSVGLPANLESLLRTQTVNGTVYLMPRAAFGNTRVMVREIDSGQIYLLDLKANTNGGELSPITIYLDEATSAEYRSADTEHHAQHDPVSLTRFAAQQLYAPLRLLSAVPGIVRVPIQQESVALVPGNAIEAKPLAAWRAGRLYVTAVKLRNRTSSARTLDPRTLRGKWLTAAFQHSRLLATGNEADTTAVYLVSAQAFGASL